jgi:hypothetical protein
MTSKASCHSLSWYESYTSLPSGQLHEIIPVYAHSIYKKIAKENFLNVFPGLSVHSD